MAAAGGEKAKSTIVIKKIKKGGHGHHGGAWKIAYADFVTAMMAFFLLMWLLGSTTKGDLKGISDYFSSPLQVAMSGGSGSGDATSLVPGGGMDLTRDVGQIKRGENLDTTHRNKVALMKAEAQRMKQLDDKLQAALEGNPKFDELRDQVKIDVTPDGLRIQIIDDFKRPMFDMGGAAVKVYMRDLLREIGSVLDEVDSPITISGHTDSAPYVGGERGYSNWELSAERANASRRELIAGGMQPAKVLRVLGLADAMPIVKDDPRSPLNRRISILVLNKIAEERLRKESSETPSGAGDDAAAAPAPAESAPAEPAPAAPGESAAVKPPPDPAPQGGGAPAAEPEPAAAKRTKVEAQSDATPVAVAQVAAADAPRQDAPAPRAKAAPAASKGRKHAAR
ncbi:MAG TPA: flagellar motor protein MotB [Burkholderiaceae bacterium]|nr:flagellar motor protein MotB [Burkholderiaceae bacterium]